MTNVTDDWGPTHWGPRFDVEYRCRRHKEDACPSCLAYSLGDARAEVARLRALLTAAPTSLETPAQPSTEPGGTLQAYTPGLGEWARVPQLDVEVPLSAPAYRAAPASPEAPAPDLAAPGVDAAVESFREAAQEWQAMPLGPDDDERRCPEWHKYRAARADLLSAISRARSEARREAFEEAAREAETYRGETSWAPHIASGIRALASTTRGDEQ